MSIIFEKYHKQGITSSAKNASPSAGRPVRSTQPYDAGATEVNDIKLNRMAIAFLKATSLQTWAADDHITRTDTSPMKITEVRAVNRSPPIRPPDWRTTLADPRAIDTTPGLPGLRCMVRRPGGHPGRPHCPARHLLARTPQPSNHLAANVQVFGRRGWRSWRRASICLWDLIGKANNCSVAKLPRRTRGTPTCPTNLTVWGDLARRRSVTRV